MAKADSNHLPYGPTLEQFQAEQSTSTSTPNISPHPDITSYVVAIRRQADKAKSFETKIGYINLGIDDLTNKKSEGKDQYQRLVDQNSLDDPDLFWSYDSALDKAINELSILRQRLILEESDRSAPAQREAVPQPKPIFATTEESPTPSVEHLASTPEIMDAKQLAQYLGNSKSWIDKNYKSVGIPYFRLGTNLRFRKDEIDKWSMNRKDAPPIGASGTELCKQEQAVKPLPNALTAIDSRAPSINPHEELLDTGVHPKTRSRIDKLTSLLFEKGCLSQSDFQRFKNWMLRRARLSPNEAKIVWLRQRKSLVTCIVLCHYAELVEIPETPGKKQPRPDFGATIERGFIAEGKSALQNIDRDCAKDIDGEINAFIEYMRAYARRNELDFPEDNILFSALAEYYDDIDGSEGMAVEIGEIRDLTQNVDYLMMKLFHALSATEGS
jgi:predicted DNA-binding transcriptional regulator AlpA